MEKEVLLIVTCFNRKELTLKFLESVRIASANIVPRKIDVVLVDDASPDFTGQEVTSRFPEVEVIYGDGNLYWVGGVRLALEYLNDRLYKYKKILLANDDIEFQENALRELIEVSDKYDAIVGGTVVTRDGLVESTGGNLGRFCKPRPRLVVANGSVQRCEMLPGHVLLIPIFRLREIGGFDKNLRYRFLDLEVTIRASRAGIPVMVAPNIVAVTNDYNHYFSVTSKMRGTCKELINQILLSPKGPHWKESRYYLRKVSPILWWLWLPFFYRAFLKAVLMSQLERIVKKINSSKRLTILV